jgi:hypothetical protein
MTGGDMSLRKSALYQNASLKMVANSKNVATDNPNRPLSNLRFLLIILPNIKAHRITD